MTDQTETPPASRWIRALVVLFGAAAFGPLAPGLAAAALVVVGTALSFSRPAGSLPGEAASTILGAYTQGGEAAALLTGLALALHVLARGGAGRLAATRAAAFMAAVVALWMARGAPLRGALLLIGGFVLIAVVTARALYRLAVAWRILP